MVAHLQDNCHQFLPASLRCHMVEVMLYHFRIWSSRGLTGFAFCASLFPYISMAGHRRSLTACRLPEEPREAEESEGELGTIPQTYSPSQAIAVLFSC